MSSRPTSVIIPPPEEIVVTSKRVACDGGGGALGHPLVYMDMGEDDHVE
ncbi:MAG: zinc-finger domain-containing protein, partial [Brevundimonas sp.]